MCGGTGSLPLGWFMVRPSAGPFNHLSPGRGDAGLIGRPAPYPTVKRIFETAMALPEFATAHPLQQPDTPEAMRPKAS